MKTTWNDASKFCQKLTLGGYTDWRLPTRMELESLLDLAQYNLTLPQGHPFTNVQSYYYWSSTSIADGTGNAWIVDMYGGSVGSDSKTDYYYVWPVRSGQCKLSDALDVRFIDYGDGTITDTTTGLMWVKDANLEKREE